MHDFIPTSQPRCVFDLGFTLNPPVDLFHVDAWLCSTELVSPLAIWPGPAKNPAPTASPIETAEAFLSRVLLVSASLQIAAKVPCFEAGEIIQISADPKEENHWLARVAAVVPAGFSESIARASLQASLRLVLALNHLQPLAENSQAIFDELTTKVVDHIDAGVPGGKSTITILAAAYRNKIPFLHLGRGSYQLGWGSRASVVDRSSIQYDTRFGAVASENKMHTAQILHAAGLPAPRHHLVHSQDAAEKAAHDLGWPVVVKPSDRNRGEGVTVHVDDTEKLRAAFQHAAKSSKNILIERQVAGVCHRILIAKDELIFAIKRRPKLVTGDGVLTLAELVEKENSELLKIVPWKRKKLIPFNDEAKHLALLQGFQPDSVIPKECVVNLREIESTEWGGSGENVADTIHPENVDLAKRASRLIGLSVCGVDLISTDISKPWHENGAKIIELNFAPFFVDARGGYGDHYLRLFFPDSGLIPIEAIDTKGKNAVAAAKRAQTKRKKAGERCYLVVDRQVFRPDGSLYPLLGKNTKELVRSLLLDPTVDSIVVGVTE